MRASPGPYYSGDPIVVQIVVRDNKPNARIDCRLKADPPAGLTFQGPQLSQSSRSFTQIINGRVSRHESVDYIFNFVVTAERPGKYRVGPFIVTIEGKKHEVAGESFQFEKLENDPDMRISVALPGNTFYVGQRVTATVRWSFAGNMNAVQYAFSNLQIRSPLFDRFAFDKQRPQTRTTLTIAMAKGSMDIDADVSRETIDGREFVTVTGKTSFIADTPGDYRDLPVTCRTVKVTDWRRDLFGDLIPRGRRPAIAAGKPLSFVIKPIPLANRPATFAGAVGRGFSISVSANRSIVRVGDPIVLTITLHGDGDMRRISLPPLSASPGWSSKTFQLPNTSPAGTVDGNSKQFTLNVRVTDTHVTQIPAVAFSWFDPAQGKFETTTSKPIALQVLQNRVISAADVVAAKSASSGTAEHAVGQPSSSQSETVAPQAFVGADLAIERDVAKLLSQSPSRNMVRVATIGMYVLAVCAVLGGVILRRHAARDMVLVQRKKHVRELTRRIDAARDMAPRAGAEQVAKALRDLIAELDPADRAAIEETIAQCDTLTYARDDTGTAQLDPLIERARQLVRTAANT